MERNASNGAWEMDDNNLVDVESFQLLPVMVAVDHRHVVQVEVGPVHLEDDYLVEHHKLHVEVVVVEQQPDKLNRR